MTPFIPGLIIGFLLGIFACGVLAFLLALHRHPAPTLHRRKNRDRPVPYIPPAWEREEGVDYKWLGMTGSEQE